MGSQEIMKYCMHVKNSCYYYGNSFQMKQISEDETDS